MPTLESARDEEVRGAAWERVEGPVPAANRGRKQRVPAKVPTNVHDQALLPSRPFAQILQLHVPHLHTVPVLQAWVCKVHHSALSGLKTGTQSPKPFCPDGVFCRLWRATCRT